MSIVNRPNSKGRKNKGYNFCSVAIYLILTQERPPAFFKGLASAPLSIPFIHTQIKYTKLSWVNIIFYLFKINFAELDFLLPFFWMYFLLYKKKKKKILAPHIKSSTLKRFERNIL